MWRTLRELLTSCDYAHALRQSPARAVPMVRGGLETIYEQATQTLSRRPTTLAVQRLSKTDHMCGLMLEAALILTTIE